MIGLDQLRLRIRQMQAAFADLEERDAVGRLPVEFVRGGGVWIDFNAGTDEARQRNVAEQLVASIACMKDYLNKWCAARTLAPRGNKLLAADPVIQIVHDLWNSQKHGEVLRGRSGRAPRLIDLKRVLLARASRGPGSFKIRLGTGEVEMTGTAAYALIGRVVDESDVMIGEFSQICWEALRLWERAAVDAGVELPSGG